MDGEKTVLEDVTTIHKATTTNNIDLCPHASS